MRTNAPRTVLSPPVSDLTSHAHSELLRTLDRLVERRAVVFGSLPPGGRDLDLVVTPADADAIGSALRAQRFVRWEGHWVSFAGCAVAVVELIPAAKLRLPDSELDAFLADAVPLPGLSRIAEPAPHHCLLILARRLRREPVLQAKHRARIDRALAADRAAWQRARERAGLWSAETMLARLESLHRRSADSEPRWLRRTGRPRRTRVIAISGVSRERTDFHADALRAALDRLGYDPSLDSPRAASGGEAGAVVRLWRPVWRRLGRGGVVVASGHALDVAVVLGSGDRDGAGLVRRARRLRRIAPRPLRAYLLDEPAGTADSEPAAAYRAAAALLSVRRLDGERTAGELCEEIAVDAWQALRRRSRLGTILRGLRARARSVRSSTR